MKGLTWVGAFVLLGVAAGATAFALTPPSYRAVTALQVTIAPDRRRDEMRRRFGRPSDEHFAEMLQRSFSADWIERLTQELGLYQQEREADRWPEALLDFRRSATFSRQVESERSERWLVAFEADDPRMAETVSSRLASSLADEVDEVRGVGEFHGSFASELQSLFERLRSAESKLARWSATNAGKTPPVTLSKEIKALSLAFSELLNEAHWPPRIGDSDRPLLLNVEVVQTPRVFDGRIGPRCLPFALAGAAAGLILGLFTMPPSVWWRKQDSDSSQR